MKLTHFKRDFGRWSVISLAISIFIVIPVGFILLSLLDGPGEGWPHIREHLLPEYISNSLKISVLSLVISVVIGVSSAWIVTYYEFPLRKVISWLLILPLAFPIYILAYSYAGLCDYEGLITHFLGFKLEIMNWIGLSFVLSFGLFPYVYLTTRALFSVQNSSLIEAAKTLINRSSKVFIRIAMPLAIPAIAAGGSLILMEALNDYGAAKYYNVQTFCTGIFKAWGGYGEENTAIYLSAILCLVILAILGVERFIRRRKRYKYGFDSKPLNRSRTSVTQRALILAWLGLILLITLILPLYQLLRWAYYTYSSVLEDNFLSITGQSILLSAISAVLCLILAVLIITVFKWNRFKPLSPLKRLGVLGYAIPGAVIALGIYSPALILDKKMGEVYELWTGNETGLILKGTLLILIYGYVIRFLAVSFSPIEAGYSKVHESISQASETLGASKWKTLTKVELPILRASMFSALLLVFVDIMKELPLTLILKPYDVDTLAVKAYEYASDERIAECACPSLMIILVGSLPIILLNKFIQKS